MITRRDFLGASALTSLAAAAATLSLPLAGCSSGSTVTTEDGSVLIRLADHSTSPVLSFALQEGVLDEVFAGQDVELEVSSFGSGPAMNEAIAASQIDIAWMGHFPAFVGSSSYGYELIATGMEAYKEAVLVATPASGIASIADLAGKKIGTYIGSNMHYFLYLYLESAGLTFDDVEVINTASETASALRGNEIDAAVFGVVTAYSLAEEGSVNIIAEEAPSGEDPYFLPLCVTSAFAETYPELTELACTAYDEAIRYRDAHKEEFLAFYEEKTGSDSASVEATWEYVDHRATIPGPVQLSASETLLTWLQDNDYAEGGVTVDNLYDTSFAEAAGLETSE